MPSSALYERSLGWVLEHSRLTLAVLGLTIALNFYLFWIVPKGFFPQQDNGIVFGGIQGSQDISFQAMQKATARIVDVVKTDPGVAERHGVHGRRGRHQWRLHLPGPETS